MTTDPRNQDATDSELQPEVLERNIELLLTRAHEPPRMRPQARANVLANLKARTAAAPADSANQPSNVTALPSRRTTAIAVAAVVAVAAAVLLALGLRTLSNDNGTDDEGGPALERVANEDAAPRRVALPDGSSVILRRGAAIERVGPRSIRLVDGEVLVDVAPDDDPFIVHTEHGRAVALGTRFTVRRIRDAIDTAVVRGTVRLENDGGEATLGAGEHGRLAAADAPSKHLGERLSHTLAWAHDALSRLDQAPKPPVRRGNLIARDQWSQQDWPLPMRELVVDVHVEDGIARTTIDQTFFNHTQRQLEGVYSFPLPTDAAISRLAMYVDGKLMEGGIVERQRGRDVYESIVYQRRDPALLEWMKGSEFRVRIFPLPARTEKRILLSYTQPLSSSYGEQHLTVPIPAIDLPVDVVEYHVHVADSDLTVESDSHPLESHGDHDVVFVANNHEIGDDLRLTLRGEVEPDRGRIVGHSDDTGDYAMVRAQPTLMQSPGHVARSWVVLYDTSASRDPSELVAQGELLRQFLHQMDEGDRVSIVAFDTEVRPMSESWSRVDALDPAGLDAFVKEQARIAAGATNLGAALDDAVARLDGESQAPHVLILGDGTATEGAETLDDLRARVEGKATVIAVSIGDGADTRTLEALANATGGMSLSLQPGEDLGWRAFEAISTLNGPRLLELQVRLLDADGNPIADVDPLVARPSLAHGESLTVLARGKDLAETAAAVVVEGQLAGQAWTQTLPLTAQSRPAAYLPRLWAQARIEAWLEDDADAHQQEITELGMKRFIITPYTSLLVLENDKMYEQFEVTRPKATDWAHYESPETIKVVHEPMGTSPLDDMFVDASALVLRDPLTMLHSGSSLYGPMGGEGIAFGLGMRGTARGGGGLGKSGFAVDTVTLGLSDAKVGVDPADELTGRDVLLEKTDKTIVGARADAHRTLDYRRTASTRSTPAQDQQRRRMARGAGLTGVLGGSRGGFLWGPVSVPAPVALHYASDWRLDDPTHFVPGLLADEYDYARERLLADPTFPEGSIDETARGLVRDARAALEAVRYEAPDGTVVVVDAEGRFARMATTPEGLLEQVVYDGDDAWALYQELGLGVRRRIGPTAPLLLTTSVPWVLPTAEHLARWYDVTSPREHTLRLVPAADPEGEATTIELDDEGRIVSLARAGVTTRLVHDAGGLTIETGGSSLTLTRVTGETTIPAVDESAWTIAEVPLRTDEHWAPQLEALEPGSDEWRHVQWQRLATTAAKGDPSTGATILHELLEEVPSASPGALALGAHAVRRLSEADRRRLSATSREDASSRWVAAIASDLRWNNQTFAPLATTDPGGLIGTLASYRAMLVRLDRGENTSLRKATERFVEDHGDSQLAYMLVHRVNAVLGWRTRGSTAALWTKLADHGTWRVAAHYAAGQALYNAGQYNEAGEQFLASVESALELGEPPIFDYYVKQGITMSRGEASFRHVWSRWRKTAREAEDVRLRASFVSHAVSLGRVDDVRRVVTTISDEQLRDSTSTLSLADQLLSGGQTQDAWRLVQRVLERDPNNSAVLDRAATISEQQGRIADAAAYLEQAMAADDDTSLTLPQVRADYDRLMRLHARLARSPLDAEEAATHRDAALEVAGRWRHEDPDNAAIDLACAELFEEDPARAWRFLSSIIERHPAEGGAYAQVAEALEREARFDDADRVWARAAKVEPTNPTWLMRRAENASALGHDADALALLEQIRDGDWQERFGPVEQQAKQLARSLK